MSETPTKPADKPADKQPAPRTEVKLKKPHTHAGQHYDAEAVKKGAKINVTAQQKTRLAERGII